MIAVGGIEAGTVARGRQTVYVWLNVCGVLGAEQRDAMNLSTA